MTLPLEVLDYIYRAALLLGVIWTVARGIVSKREFDELRKDVKTIAETEIACRAAKDSDISNLQKEVDYIRGRVNGVRV